MTLTLYTCSTLDQCRLQHLLPAEYVACCIAPICNCTREITKQLASEKATSALFEMVDLHTQDAWRCCFCVFVCLKSECMSSLPKKAGMDNKQTAICVQHTRGDRERSPGQTPARYLSTKRGLPRYRTAPAGAPGLYVWASRVR